MKYIHLYNNTETFNNEYHGEKYIEPWVSTISGTQNVAYNKTQEQKDRDAIYGKPLTFDVLSSGYIQFGNHSRWENIDIEYKLNDGEWTTYTKNQKIQVVANDVLQYKANDTSTFLDDDAIIATCTYNVSGNIHSCRSKDFVGEDYSISAPYSYYGLFMDNTGLRSAENLLLPWDDLPYETYGEGSYFAGIYECLFKGCTGLTVAPALPATTLGYRCYYEMFYGCSSLTSAPDLLATTPALKCYERMFYDCTSLNYVKCLLTETSVDYTYDWLNGVASSGTFIYSPNAKWGHLNPYTQDANENSIIVYCGIPENWTKTDVNNANTMLDSDAYFKFTNPDIENEADYPVGYSTTIQYENSVDYNFLMYNPIMSGGDTAGYFTSYTEDYSFVIGTLPECISSVTINGFWEWNIPRFTININFNEEYEDYSSQEWEFDITVNYTYGGQPVQLGVLHITSTRLYS